MRAGWVGRLLASGVLAGAGLTAVAATAQTPGENKTFHDWVAGCDNLKSCTALSLPAQGADTTGFLKLERAGGPAGSASLSLKLIGERLQPPLAVKLSLDGAPFPAADRTFPATLADEDTALIRFSNADAAALIAAARKATRLSTGMAGKHYTVSLSGAVAALLWIDEQQGRPGTVTALIRKGDAPASQVPKPPPIPVMTAKPTRPELDKKAAAGLGSALRKHLKTSDPDNACDEGGAGVSEPDRAWPLSARQKLVGLFCGSGAYNVATGYWIVTGDAVASARPIAFQEHGRTATSNVLTNANYDPKTGRIDSFNKGRGIADCGINAHYAWTGKGFALTGYAIMDECRGIPWDDWLALYSSEVKIVP